MENALSEVIESNACTLIMAGRSTTAGSELAARMLGASLDAYACPHCGGCDCPALGCDPVADDAEVA